MSWDIGLIFFVLAVIIPWRGRLRLQKLLTMPQVSSAERIALYASTIAFQWLAATVVAWRAWAHGYTAMELGLTIHGQSKIPLVSIVGAATMATLQWLNLRRMRRVAVQARGLLQAIAERILPQSTIELLPFLALAVTAGLCEEFLYRGFTMAVLARWGSPVWLVVLASSILFGLAHLYQGRGGFFSTTVIGGVLGGGRIAFGSLIPVIFWHTAVDFVAGIVGPLYLIEKQTVTLEKGH